MKSRLLSFLFTGIVAAFSVSKANAAVYYISAGNLVNTPNNCGSTASYYSDCGGGQPGFQWTSTEGVAPVSVTIEFSIGVECGGCCGNGLTRSTSLNGVGQANFNTNDWCNCDNSNNPVITISVNPGNYSVGGVNTFLITNASSCFGYIPSGALGGYYARVTVVTGPPCGWSGWSGTNYPTIPCGSFSSNISVGSGTYTYFTAVAGQSYTVSTCGSPFDTDLTIYDANPAWSARAWNQDNGPDCGGTNASLTWTATYSGDHIAIVNRVGCQQHDFTGQSAILKFRKNSGCGCTPNQPTTTWTGSVNNDWFNGSNWTNCVPGVNTNATVPVVGTSYPVINGQPAYVNTITVNAGATVTSNTTLTATQ
jgi:hypothetical protein